MFGSRILEVAIGVIFVFILVSVVCTAVREVIEAWLKTRSAYLEQAIRELLHDRHDGSLTQAFYEHPLIHGLFDGDYQATDPARTFNWRARGHNLPSYIPARSFAMALMDLAARGPIQPGAATAPGGEFTAEAIRAHVGRIGNPAVQRVLLTALDEARGDLDRARANVEEWFDSAMDRVSGRYKRSSQWIILVIGLTVAVALNVDAIRIAKHLYRNDAARTALVARAEALDKLGDTATVAREAKAARAALDSVALPIGWTSTTLLPQHRAPRFSLLSAEWWGFAGTRLLSIFSHLPGWLITGAAASLGAPFWFDVLNKVMVIRSTVKPREKSPEEGTEDRLARTGATPAEPARRAALTGATATQATATGDGGAATAGGVEMEDEPDEVNGERIDPAETTADDELPPAQGGVA